jgi:tRNA1Val (adenine37-N6)-methyltransferase
VGETQGVTSDETIDELRGHDLRIVQHRHGYRFSIDPLLLAEFAAIGEGESVIDLGTGCGIIPLLLARKAAGARIVGVEQQQGMAALAQRNVGQNGLADRIAIIEADVLELRERFPVASFDLVTANPPYRKRGTGIISPKAGRDQARHESTAGLADFLTMAKYLVRPSGRICFIYLAARLAELLAIATELKLSPLRLRMVHGNPAAEAKMFVVELVKGRPGELKILPPLVVYGDNGVYTHEMEKILR